MTCNFVEKKFLLFFNRKRLNYNTQESFPILQHFQRHCTEYSAYSFYSYISYFTVVHNSLFFSCLVRKWPSFLLIYASMGYNYHMEVGLKQTEFSPNLFLNCVNLSQAKFHNFVTFSQKIWKKCPKRKFSIPTLYGRRGGGGNGSNHNCAANILQLAARCNGSILLYIWYRAPYTKYNILCARLLSYAHGVLMQLSDFTKQAHLIFVPTIESKH